MKFLNLLRAFTLLLLGVILMTYWYSAESTATTIPTISVDNIEEEPKINFGVLYEKIDTLEMNNTDDKALSVAKLYLSKSRVYSPKTAFLAFNLTNGEYISYNVDTRITGASVIKSAYCLYVLNKIEQGSAFLDETIVYKKDDKRKGTGVIQFKEFGTEYSVKSLIYLSITESDNVAHKMLVDKFGRKEFNAFLDELGIESMHLYSNGNTDYYNNLSARDLARILTKIYEKSTQNENYKWYLDIMSKAKYNRFSDSTEYPVAHKSGFMKGAFHDAGIVLAPEPYIVIVLTNGNAGETEENYLKELSKILCEKMEKP